MSQHIGNNHHHHQKTKYSYTTFGSQTMSTHMYIYRNRMFVYKKYGPTGPCHIKVQQNQLTSLIKNGTPKYHTNHGASKAPPAAPPSGGGGGPPLPAPCGGGGSSARPPCPGGRRPLVIAASTAVRRRSDRHGGGNPTHCSRTSSSWIWIHKRSGTPHNTVSKRRTTSSSAPAAAGGACDGPAPGSSQRRLCAGLSGPTAPAAASLGRLAPRAGLSCSGGTGAWTMSTSRPRGATSAQTPNKQQATILVSIHQNMYTRISNTNTINHKTETHHVPLSSKASPGGSTISGSFRKSTPTYGNRSMSCGVYRHICATCSVK
jgi:hypothetical protein